MYTSGQGNETNRRTGMESLWNGVGDRTGKWRKRYDTKGNARNDRLMVLSLIFQEMVTAETKTDDDTEGKNTTVSLYRCEDRECERSARLVINL